jgi:lipooligosaccharide transport system permease protein
MSSPHRSDTTVDLRSAAAMWHRNALIGRKTIFTTLGPRFVEAIAYLLIMGMGLGTYLRTVDGVDYVTFIAPGVACASVMFGAILETT